MSLLSFKFCIIIIMKGEKGKRGKGEKDNKDENYNYNLGTLCLPSFHN